MSRLPFRVVTRTVVFCAAASRSEGISPQALFAVAGKCRMALPTVSWLRGC